VSTCDSSIDSFIVSHIDSYFLIVNVGDTAKGEKQSTSAKGRTESTAADAFNQEGEFDSILDSFFVFTAVHRFSHNNSRFCHTGENCCQG
jgi:hypothetical protein